MYGSALFFWFWFVASGAGFKIAFKFMKIGIGQIDTKVGDFSGNAEKIMLAAEKFAAAGADFGVFPECSVSGYPLGDLVCYESFVSAARAEMERLAEIVPIPVIVGCPNFAEGGAIGFENAAFLLCKGRVDRLCGKCLLPNYGALNDARNFDAAQSFGVANIGGHKVGVCICEDIWTLPFVETAKRYEGRNLPLDFFASLNAGGKKGLDVLVNISASIFSRKNDNVRGRGKLLWKVSEKIKAPVLWCNLVGGEDNLIFAGGSGFFWVESDAAGNIVSERSKCLEKFVEECAVVDAHEIEGYDGDSFDFRGEADVCAAIELGIRDFMRKCGIKKAFIGLSGGIDSALVAALAVAALGSENVLGVSMPSVVSSQHSKKDAEDLARNLGIEFHTVGIEGIVSAVEEALSEAFKNRPKDVTEENIQSRARGLTLMAFSNKFGGAVLVTGNKSECSVGYCTLYGDTCGAYAPISDLYKTEVYGLSRFINGRAGREIIPQSTLLKPPSAELRPGQKDEDSLPPYDILDAILRMHIEGFKSADEIKAAGFDGEVVKDVLGKVARAEYKRRQYPLGPKISETAYSLDRRVPVAGKCGIL